MSAVCPSCGKQAPAGWVCLADPKARGMVFVWSKPQPVRDGSRA